MPQIVTRRFCGAHLALALLLLLPSTAPAQVASSTLLGEVRDATGAVLPGVKVTASHRPTGFQRTTLTGHDGAYRIDELLPGPYEVTASLAGFRTAKADSVFLEVNQKGRLDLALNVGDQAESITVTAEVSPLQASDASIGYRLDSAAITGLPLAQRNVINLVTLGPGAIPRQLGGFVHDVVNDIQPVRGAVALNPPVNGARATMNSYLLDGALNTDLNTYAIAVNPPMEAVQEFRIQSSLPAAEFAQSGGAVIDAISKSGGRDYHGSLFEYFRNEALDARNFFDDPQLPRPIFRGHQFGGSLGGPLPLPSTFFFATYEGVRGRSGKSSLALVPDAALRAGEFAGRNPIYDPFDLDATGARRPFPGNRIPADRIDPIARTFLERFQPLPNRPPGSASNYMDATPNEDSDDNVSARIDHEFHSAGHLFGRYTLNDQYSRQAGIFPELPVLQQLRAQQAALAHTWAAARWLNSLRFAFTRFRVFSLPESAFRTDVARELGITGIPSDPFTFGLPNFLISNFSTVTDSTLLPQVQRDNIWHLSESLALVRGRHTWKFGAQWVGFQMAYLQTRLARGQFIFTGALTSAAGSPVDSGDAFADFLLGLPQVTNRNVGLPQAYMRRDTYAGYLQDDWRISRRLTLNFGVRYEYFSPYTEKRDAILNLDYSRLPATPPLVRANRAVDPDRNNVSPRAGLAWQAGRGTVLRAGYGVYFSPEIAVEVYDLVRNGVRNESNVTNGTRPLLTLRNGFPESAATGLPGLFSIDPHARTPYVQQWTASVQQELPGRIALETAYAGTRGTRLGRYRQFNTALHAVTGANLPPRPGELQSLRPFPELGEIIHRQHISNSVYHSLQIKAEKRFARNLGFLASFVWSKSIDDADTVVTGFFESVGAQDERNLRLERGLSFFDVRRRVSAGVVYDLPRSPVLSPVLSGWRLSGILTLQDGTPLNPVFFVFDPANTGTPNRPDVVPGQSIALPRSQRTPERFFNTDAFRAPAPFTFGNAGRNIIPGPGNNVIDLALHRRIAVREGHAAELRVELFNAMNHPNFGLPGPYPDFGPFYGRILATGEPRRIQLALRYQF